MRHGLALAVTIIVPCLLWTIVYFALLLWAVITGEGLGGPLAYPAGLLFFLVATIVGGSLLLFPSAALAEWCARRRAWPILAQIPLSLFTLAVLPRPALATVTGARSPLFPSVSAGFAVLFIGYLLPLGLYWWAAQSGPLLLSLIRRLIPR